MGTLQQLRPSKARLHWIPLMLILTGRRRSKWKQLACWSWSVEFGGSRFSNAIDASKVVALPGSNIYHTGRLTKQLWRPGGQGGHSPDSSCLYSGIPNMQALMEVVCLVWTAEEKLYLQPA